MSYHVDPDFLPPGARVNTTYTRRVLLRRLDQAIRRIEAKAKANPEYAEDYRQAVQRLKRQRAEVTASNQKTFTLTDLAPGLVMAVGALIPQTNCNFQGELIGKARAREKEKRRRAA